MTKPAAPLKPAYGAPCNGCGACCRAVPCRMARDLVGAFDAPCPALEHDGARYWAAAMAAQAAAGRRGAARGGLRCQPENHSSTAA